MSDYDKLVKRLKDSKQESKPPVEESSKSSTYKKIPVVEIKSSGVYRHRLLPNKQDHFDLPYEAVNVHFGFTHPNFNKKAPMVCQGKGCPMCVVYERKKARGADDAWRYQAKQRFIYYALNSQNEIVLLSLNYYAHEKLSEKIFSYAKSKVNIMDLAEGHWFEITLNIVEKKYNYNVAIDTEQHRVSKEIRKEFDELKPLTKFYLNHTIPELIKILKGEKVVMNYNNSSTKPSSTKPATTSTSTSKPKIKDPSEMKFDSDKVDAVDDSSEVKVADDDNLKRLQDIMGQLDLGEDE